MNALDEVTEGELYACTTSGFNTTTSTYPFSHCYLEWRPAGNMPGNYNAVRFDPINSASNGVFLDYSRDIDSNPVCIKVKDGMSHQEASTLYTVMEHQTGNSQYGRYDNNCCSSVKTALERIGITANNAGMRLIDSANLGFGTVRNRRGGPPYARL